MVVENYHKYYSTVPYSNKELNFYDGYWQTDKYFEDFREELCHEFSPTEEIANKVEQWKKVQVHINVWLFIFVEVIILIQLIKSL